MHTFKQGDLVRIKDDILRNEIEDFENLLGIGIIIGKILIEYLHHTNEWIVLFNNQLLYCSEYSLQKI